MNLLLFAPVLVAAAWSLRLFMSASVRKRSAELADASIDPAVVGYTGEDGGGRLAVWLSLAGFRDPSASTIFLGATAGMIASALAIVRFEGCQICHEVHGSANPRMLIRQSVQYVCLECHANLPTINRTSTIGVVPPAFHDLRSPIFQNCTVCHQKIHGSHVDRNLLR